MTFIRLCSPELDTSPEALLRRIEALERGGGLRRGCGARLRSRWLLCRRCRRATVKAEAAEKPAPRSATASTEALLRKGGAVRRMAGHYRGHENYSHSGAAAFNGSSAYVNGESMLIEAPQIAFDLLKRASQRDKKRRRSSR